MASLEDIKNEAVDLESIPIEEVFNQLKCTAAGLSSADGELRLQLFGPNKLEEKTESKLLKFLGFMWNPLSWVMEIAALMAIVLANGGGKPPDWQDFIGIVVLQVSIISQALIFVTRSRSWSFVERPGVLLITAFLAAQLVATLIAVYASWSFARIDGIGWGWAGIIWIFSCITFFPLDVLKFITRYTLSGKAWDNLLQNKTAFTNKRDYGKGEREAQWAAAQRTLHGLQPAEAAGLFHDNNNYRELSEIAEQAKRRAEVARLRELHTLKGHVESVVKLKGLDIETIQQHYTV